MNKRKICLVSATRAEWYLLSHLCKEIKKDKDLILQILVTGTHLSQEFGLTYKEIEKEFKIDEKIPILLSNDDNLSLCKSMALVFEGFSKAFKSLKPDIVVILGDRYEMLAVASVCLLMQIPIAHLCGGELTLGAIDDSIRHSITKMAHLHFVSTKEYQNRVLQLGENKNSVFNIGSLGGFIVKNMDFLSKEELEKELDFKFDENIYLITYHPETLNLKQTKNNIQTLLCNLTKLKKASLIFTKANADENGLLINNFLADFCKKYPQKAKLFDNLGSKRYLSLMKISKAVIGNSSSGIIESPFLRVACINIGDRQKGRIRSENIIDTSIKDLQQAFQKLEDKKFQDNLKNFKNPFESRIKNPNKFIKTKLKNVKLDTILNKKFTDLLWISKN
ncbi:UDP-N-acetylglucosamine 2-epimerase (hydrolyzing) [Campylobacter novaezeelandiae]|uniref:UDP-N-acetylglucosamine 2-epimerase (Hydrolyzing) n=1 Tax=Campylobacter novaezeelandiae TaxID=2267891 RepID=A0A4Q9JUI6_9BACT|nr:UDP-N-acetylglucosamine 2-epimerase [Campylobacter novaezeelandiae]TBR78226.1 UDP-N-acetylglucosamine 2-epimerase (hydrolyzing) [Campylobacter novaezeelandiae]TBR81324.1 UDP-N-acetylglucosamine 2-epimerase (hydrolyzing) [Campylobacter novaezeelandiae]